MRSNYNPYPQHNAAKLQEHFNELEIAKRQVLLANENLAKVLAERIPLMLQHFSLQRGLVKLNLDQLKRELQTSNSTRVTATDQAWASTMNDIESLRAEHHTKMAEEAEQRRIVREERASLGYDHEVGQQYIIRKENYTGADGLSKTREKKVYLPADHEYLK